MINSYSDNETCELVCDELDPIDFDYENFKETLKMFNKNYNPWHDMDFVE